MPVLKHAKKKLRQDKKRTERNKTLKDLYKKLVKEARASKSKEAVSKAFSSIDKAAKQNILPKNRAARLKSALNKAVEGTAKKAAAPAPVAKKPAVKKTVKKAAPKKK